MFPTRYFADRMFAPRYWAKVGADVVTQVPTDFIPIRGILNANVPMRGLLNANVELVGLSNANVPLRGEA